MVVSVPEFVAFYGPLVGLVGVAFWLGRLTQKVTTQAEEIGSQKAAFAKAIQDLEERIEDVRLTGGADVTRIVRLEVQMENVTRTNEAVSRGMEGIQRQLANIIQQGPPRPFRVHSNTAEEG